MKQSRLEAAPDSKTESAPIAAADDGAVNAEESDLPGYVQFEAAWRKTWSRKAAAIQGRERARKKASKRTRTETERLLQEIIAGTAILRGR